MCNYSVIASDDNGVVYYEEFRYKGIAFAIADELSVKFPDWHGIVQEFGKNGIHVIRTFGIKESLGD